MATTSRLRVLVELAATGSVRATAARLVVTESSVSSALSALSAEVGVPLVERVGRGVRLTPAGERYVVYAQRILNLQDEAVLAAKGEADPEHGAVRLAAVTTAGELLLPALLASFRAKHPGVVLDLDVAPRGRVWPLLTRHEVDLVVAGRPPRNLVDAQVCGVSPNTLVVVGAGDRDAESGLQDVTWLLREPESGTRATCLSLLERLEITPPLMTLGSHGAVVAAAVAGLGVTLVSRQAVRAELASGALVEIPVRGTPLDRPWHVVAQTEPTASTRLLIEHLLADRDLGWQAPFQ
jgi:DNA-binding transcriptional LysR family regulator